MSVLLYFCLLREDFIYFISFCSLFQQMLWHYKYHAVLLALFVPDRSFVWSQLARLTRQQGCNLRWNVYLYVNCLCYLYFSYLWCVPALIYRCSRSGTLYLGRPSVQSQAKPAAWEALRNVPSHVTKKGRGSVYFWREATMDSFAAAPLTS